MAESQNLILMLPLPGLKELLAKISPQPLWMMVSYYLFYTYMLRMSHNLYAIFWAKKPANYYSYPSKKNTAPWWTI